MKIMYRAILMAVAVALLVASVAVHGFATETDNRIESAAQQSYVFQKYLKDDAITIKSEDGAVTLTGTVAEESHKALAEETVASLPGVKSVDNKLTFKTEDASVNSDAWVTMKVKTALFFHRNVSAMTEVSTKGKVVTLQGVAASQAQKDLTTEYVKDVDGVKDVRNEMTVSAETAGSPDAKTMGEKIDAMGESIDDASITGLVKVTLLYHRSTSGLRTKVETDKGVVTLEGMARSAAVKDLATKYAEDVYGVKSVVNNMTIGEPKAD
jgi:hyperosmotically inducible protein